MEITPMNMQVLDARRDASGGYRVDVSRGERVGWVSSEWFSRPADERYLSLNELAHTVRDRTDRSRTRMVESALIHVKANRADPERLALMLPGSETPVAPTHWSFGQLASQVGAPAAYLRQLPAALAGINLQYGLTANRAEQIKTLETDDGRVELRAVTSPDYGRIFDHELVEAVQRIAGNGTGDTRWRVPSVLDWSTGIYNPRVDISKDTTTLYASDRDVFLFLVDDLNPIEASRLWQSTNRPPSTKEGEQRFLQQKSMSWPQRTGPEPAPFSVDRPILVEQLKGVQSRDAFRNTTRFADPRRGFDSEVHHRRSCDIAYGREIASE
jgi:hypothetical protein